MKYIVLTCLAVLGISSQVYSHELVNSDLTVQQQDTTYMDTVKADGKKHKVTIRFGNGVDNTLEVNKQDDDDKGTLKKHGKKPKVILGITLARFDLGLTTLLDHGSFSLRPENSFLENRTWKTINVGFDVFQFGYRFDEKFRLFLSAGFDWTHLRLTNDVIIDRNTTPLSYTVSDIHYSKNRFSSSYLRIPLTFEHRFGPDRDLRLAYGPIGGFLLSGSQKFKSSEEGKRKVKDDFNYAKFRYGGFVRVGYQSFGLFAKYYLNDMFENSPNQEDLKNFSFGVMLFF